MAFLLHLALVACAFASLATFQIAGADSRANHVKRRRRESSPYLPKDDRLLRLRQLEDVAANDDAAYNDAAAYNDGGGDDDGATYDDALRAYEKQAEETFLDMFQESPASWTSLEWVAFAALLLLFSSCCFCVCFCCIVPRMCRKRTVELYAANLLV